MKLDSLRILTLEPFLKAKNIAIVGNGGITAYDAKRIKDADHVIRFNNFASRQGILHPEEKTRCDTLFSTFDLHSTGVRPKNVVIGIPFPFKAAEIQSKPDRWYPMANLWMVNPYWNHQMTADFQFECSSWDKATDLNIDPRGWRHPFPSLGFTALHHLVRLGININSEVYVCGFNWYYDSETKKMQGFELNHKPRPKHFNHDYWKEAVKICEEIVGRKNITFSPECHKILDKVHDAMD